MHLVMAVPALVYIPTRVRKPQGVVVYVGVAVVILGVNGAFSYRHTLKPTCPVYLPIGMVGRLTLNFKVGMRCFDSEKTTTSQFCLSPKG